jgi:hypothetical protein
MVNQRKQKTSTKIKTKVSATALKHRPTAVKHSAKAVRQRVTAVKHSECHSGETQ